MKKPVLWLLFLMACAIGLLSQSKDVKPKLTDQQKLEIRSAQVQLYQAKEVLEATPQFKAFRNAQNHLDETALRIQRESKVDPAKFTLGQDLEYVAVPEPAKPPEKK